MQSLPLEIFLHCFIFSNICFPYLLGWNNIKDLLRRFAKLPGQSLEDSRAVREGHLGFQPGRLVFVTRSLGVPLAVMLTCTDMDNLAGGLTPRLPFAKVSLLS